MRIFTSLVLLSLFCSYAWGDNKTVEEALETRIRRVAFVNTPLSNIFIYLEKVTGVKMIFDNVIVSWNVKM